MTVVRLANPVSAADISSFALRINGDDAQSVIRVVGHQATLACFAHSSFGVLVMRATALAETAEVDEVVEAGTLAARASSSLDGLLELPPPVPALRWAGALPPLSGWQQTGSLTLADARNAVANGVSEFRRRIDGVPDGDRTRAVLESIAADIWDREVSGVPVRMLHAAEAHQFLGGEQQTGEVRVLESGRWRRVDAPYGVTLARTGSALDLLIG